MINMLKTNHQFKNLISSFMAVAVVGFVISLISIMSTIVARETYNLPLCMSSDCIDYAYKLFGGSFKIISAIIGLLTSIATIGGIFVALLNYVNVSDSSALNNHISHFKIFSDYLIFEVSKQGNLKVSAINIFKLYNLIFPSSRLGDMNVSNNYISLVNRLNNEINESNNQAKNANSESFRYKQHQKRIIDCFDTLGIKLEFHPRNDFFEIEGQLFELVSIINQAFCSDSQVPDLVVREYI